MKNKTLKYRSLKLLIILFIFFFPKTKLITRTIINGNNSFVSNINFVENCESRKKNTIKFKIQTLDLPSFEEKENCTTSHKNIFQFSKRKIHQNSKENIYFKLRNYAKKLFIFYCRLKIISFEKHLK